MIIAVLLDLKTIAEKYKREADYKGFSFILIEFY